ncbi:hypothetical protein FOCG_14694 [Fusarium oxysporum f. sp. radicis-lycopersici 26381]|nr:hypothetical protein FOCG_14694 [Fusarium oxysporum f. sp. radicis-lycopersici 26381]
MNHSILSRATLIHHRQSASYKRDVAPHELVDGSGRGELTAELHATLGQTAIRTPTRPFIFMGNLFQDSLGAPLDNWPIHCFEESHELQPRRINNVKRPRLFFFITNAFRLLEEFSGAGGKSTAHPQPGCSPPSFFCRSLPRFPAFIEAAFATSFYHHYFHPPASTVALGCCILFMGG